MLFVGKHLRTDLANSIFRMFTIVRTRYLWKKNGKVARKIGKFAKNLKCFFLWERLDRFGLFFFKNSSNEVSMEKKFGKLAREI
jgi:hypothetical protein